MLVVSNVSNSLDVYTGEVNGFPIKDGDCEHLRVQLNNLNKFSPKECEVELDRLNLILKNSRRLILKCQKLL
jgi:hypothetical protein